MSTEAANKIANILSRAASAEPSESKAEKRRRAKGKAATAAPQKSSAAPEHSDVPTLTQTVNRHSGADGSAWESVPMFNDADWQEIVDLQNGIDAVRKHMVPHASETVTDAEILEAIEDSDPEALAAIEAEEYSLRY